MKFSREMADIYVEYLGGIIIMQSSGKPASIFFRELSSFVATKRNDARLAFDRKSSSVKLHQLESDRTIVETAELNALLILAFAKDADFQIIELLVSFVELFGLGNEVPVEKVAWELLRTIEDTFAMDDKEFVEQGTSMQVPLGLSGFAGTSYEQIGEEKFEILLTKRHTDRYNARLQIREMSMSALLGLTGVDGFLEVHKSPVLPNEYKDESAQAVLLEDKYGFASKISQGELKELMAISGGTFGGIMFLNSTVHDAARLDVHQLAVTYERFARLVDLPTLITQSKATKLGDLN